MIVVFILKFIVTILVYNSFAFPNPFPWYRYRRVEATAVPHQPADCWIGHRAMQGCGLVAYPGSLSVLLLLLLLLC